jgi:hypothetical protein
LFARPVVVVAYGDVVLVLFQYGFEVVEELRVVAVVFAEHLEGPFFAHSGFPAECVVDFGMVGVQRFVHVDQKGVDGLAGTLKTISQHYKHFSELPGLFFENTHLRDSSLFSF